MKKFFEEKERITKTFLRKRDAAPRNFWCHTKEATEFYAYWDGIWSRIQAYLDKKWKSVSAAY